LELSHILLGDATLLINRVKFNDVTSMAICVVRQVVSQFVDLIC